MELIKHPKLCGLLKDLDHIAKETGAIKRRRNLKSGERLLWLALTYAGLPESFRGVSARAGRAGCKLNDTSVRSRVKNAVEFQQEVLNLLLFGAGRELRGKGIERRICLQDAPSISEPGSKGTDWRLHTVYVLGQGLAHVELTSASVGEGLLSYSSPSAVQCGVELEAGFVLEEHDPALRGRGFFLSPAASLATSTPGLVDQRG